MNHQPSTINHSRSAFTLIELLVVVAIVALLAALLMPALQGARRQAKVAACQSNARQVGLVVLVYADDYRAFVPPNLTTNFTAAYVKNWPVYFCPANRDWYGRWGNPPVYWWDPGYLYMAGICPYPDLYQHPIKHTAYRLDSYYVYWWSQEIQYPPEKIALFTDWACEYTWPALDYNHPLNGGNHRDTPVPTGGENLFGVNHWYLDGHAEFHPRSRVQMAWLAGPGNQFNWMRLQE